MKVWEPWGRFGRPAKRGSKNGRKTTKTMGLEHFFRNFKTQKTTFFAIFGHLAIFGPLFGTPYFTNSPLKCVNFDQKGVKKGSKIWPLFGPLFWPFWPFLCRKYRKSGHPGTPSPAEILGFHVPAYGIWDVSAGVPQPARIPKCRFWTWFVPFHNLAGWDIPDDRVPNVDPGLYLFLFWDLPAGVSQPAGSLESQIWTCFIPFSNLKMAIWTPRAPKCQKSPNRENRPDMK